MHFNTKRQEFISHAKERIFVNTGESEKQINKVKGKVARNMYKVAKYARRVGMDINAHNLPSVGIEINDSAYRDEEDASCLNGVITIRAAVRRIRDGKIVLDRPWKNGQTLAHEVFHVEQERLGNLPYLTRYDRAYSEGGADFFAYAYVTRHNLRNGFTKKGYIINQIDGLIGKNKCEKIQKEFTELPKNKRTEFLGKLLRQEGASQYPKLFYYNEANVIDKYIRGAKFAAVSFMANGYNIKETIKCFLEKGREEHVSYLSNADISKDNIARAFVDRVRSYPVVTRLEYYSKQYIKNRKNKK